jgi:ABC-type oligopeptide transport system substrate-binding subunit
MENERLIDIFPTENYLGENIKLLDSPDIGILNNEELKALEKVRKKFQNFDNQKIIEYSERREVWKNSELREAIDYQPLFELE